MKHLISIPKTRKRNRPPNKKNKHKTYNRLDTPHIKLKNVENILNKHNLSKSDFKYVSSLISDQFYRLKVYVGVIFVMLIVILLNIVYCVW